jgi:hypothetical protein
MNPTRPLQHSRPYYDGLKLAIIAACFIAGAVLLGTPEPVQETPKTRKPPLITFPKDGAKFESPVIPFEGSGEPGTTLQLVIDGFCVEAEKVGQDGRWYMQYELGTKGTKKAHVREVDAAGVVGASSNEVLFFMDARDSVRLDRSEGLKAPGPVQPAPASPVPGAN